MQFNGYKSGGNWIRMNELDQQKLQFPVAVKIRYRRCLDSGSTCTWFWTPGKIRNGLSPSCSRSMCQNLSRFSCYKKSLIIIRKTLLSFFSCYKGGRMRCRSMVIRAVAIEFEWKSWISKNCRPLWQWKFGICAVWIMAGPVPDFGRLERSGMLLPCLVHEACVNVCHDSHVIRSHWL